MRKFSHLNLKAGAGSVNFKYEDLDLEKQDMLILVYGRVLFPIKSELYNGNS